MFSTWNTNETLKHFSYERPVHCWISMIGKKEKLSKLEDYETIQVRHASMSGSGGRVNEESLEAQKPPNTYEDSPGQETKIPSALKRGDTRKQVSEQKTAPSVTFPAFGFRFGFAERVCTKHLLRLNRRGHTEAALRVANSIKLAALETHPFPLTVLFKRSGSRPVRFRIG
jgi:hypothetical protein